jgi:predicted aspartyl protease
VRSFPIDSSFRTLLLATMLATAVQAEVPLRRDATGHVVVPTMIDGTGPVDFIMDTGADETGVYGWLAKRLNLPATGSTELSGATGSAQSVRLRVSALSVDGHEIDNFLADTLPDRSDAAQLGGVVGADLMAGRLAVMDFGCGTAALLPVSSSRRVVGRRAHLVNAGSIRDGKQLTLPVAINGVSGLALLDSGARTTLINELFARAAGLDPQSAAFRDGDPARGASQEAVNSRVGTIGTVTFAGITREGTTSRVVNLPFLEQAGLANSAVMVLGLDLLQGTRLSVDYSGRRFWIAPRNAHPRRPRVNAWRKPQPRRLTPKRPGRSTTPTAPPWSS